MRLNVRVQEPLAYTSFNKNLNILNSMKYKVNEISKLTGLSRSTLLYYEKLGLVVPEKEWQNDYRLYSKCDLERLRKVCLYREMGITLNEIKNILNEKETDVKGILESQLININNKIQTLRVQQKKILEIIKVSVSDKNTRFMNKNTWVNILRNTGLDDKGMNNWHKAFEKNAPEAHQDFLESLGLTEEEILGVRKLSQKS